MNRKIILLFVIIVIATGTAFFCLTPAQPATISAAEKTARQKEQQIFADWYEEYVVNLEQLDFNWKQYHRISGDLREEIISADTANERLTALEAKQNDRIKTIKALIPPTELRAEIYDLTSAIYKKQLAYATAQQLTITKSVKLLDSEAVINETDEELSRQLSEICIANAPAALFTAEEISAIREYFALIDKN